MAEVEKLAAEAAELEQRLAQETAIAEKIASLRGKVAASAKPVAVEAEAPVARKVQHVGRVRGFASADDAEVCGRWIRGFLLNRTEDRAWYERNVEERALSSNDNAKGAVFIPETFAASVIRLVDQYTAIPQQANVIPMSSNTLYIPRRTGGNTAYFVNDNTETTASDMATDNVLLSTKDCRVATRVPNSLIEDSVIDLAGLVAQEFALALSRKIDDAGFAGDGTSTHGGIRGIQWRFENETLAGENDSGESSLSALTIDDFVETVGKLPSYARPTAAWYVTPQVYSTCMLPLMLEKGLSAAEIAGGVSEGRFLGYPVYFNNSMRTAPTSDQVIALFGDMKMSTHFGLRSQIAVRASTDRYIEFDQTYFVASVRFDVVTSDLGDATTAGPVVSLRL
ncbi:MAG: phage major capsid protein [Caulobacteraceae bacterium]|nr:phage major capsid protein [Caulobacteraceae bacterium]